MLGAHGKTSSVSSYEGRRAGCGLDTARLKHAASMRVGDAEQGGDAAGGDGGVAVTLLQVCELDQPSPFDGATLASSPRIGPFDARSSARVMCSSPYTSRT